MDYIVVYKDENLQKKEVLKDIDWSRKNISSFSKCHGLSSYLAMFCPALPDFFVKKYTKKNDVVMDNFSGRGTTALVSRELKRKFVGNDLNPYAFVLSRFKVEKTKKEKLLAFLSEMEKEYLSSKYKDMKIDVDFITIKELTYFYSEYTLRQLLFLRDKYGMNWKSNNSSINGILSFALGLMHGPTKKDGSTIYFSLNMPNTISMSPNYVNNYRNKHNLVLPKVNIFEKIRDRINKKYDTILEEKYDGKVYHHDSTVENKKIKNESIDLVVTSPPYLSIVNYTKSNWLKLWLLGYERKSLDNKIKLSDTLKFDEYIIFIKKYLDAIYPKLKKNAKVCLIVGDVFEKKLIEDVWKNIKKDVNYKFVELYYDYKYIQTHKVTNMLNKKSGRATKIDKVLVIERV